jgi:protein-tyrosine-phosphatase/DNA-binding transcriptional ArsR family regulator
MDLSGWMYAYSVGTSTERDSAATPPGFLRLAGHPVRWQLLNELARSDRPVRELTALIGQQQSLTSYHLGLLRAGGLVSTRQSSADKRDTYYSLDLAACRELLAEAGASLHPGLRLVPPAPPSAASDRWPTQPDIRVLFLCTGNSGRSQVAEAFLEHLGGPGVEAVSAGSHPKPVHPNAVRVMREHGIDISDRRSKNLSEFTEQPFDYVISLCDRVREVCPDFPGSPAVAHWSMPDPAADEHSYSAFVRTADELNMRIHFLLYVMEHDLASSERI